MKFHDTLAILSVVVFGAVSVFAQCPDVVLNGLHDLTNITYTATFTTQAVTKENAYAQVFRVGAEFANIMDGIIQHADEMNECNEKAFSNEDALVIFTAFRAHVDSYIGFLDALVVKNDIIVSEHSPFNPDARPIALILPGIAFITEWYGYMVVDLIPTLKDPGNALVVQLNEAFKDTVKVYPTPEQANKVPWRVQF